MYYGVQISLRNVTNQPVSWLHDTETSTFRNSITDQTYKIWNRSNLSDLKECTVLSSVTENLFLTDTTSNCTRIWNHKLKAFLLLVWKIHLVKLNIE